MLSLKLMNDVSFVSVSPLTRLPSRIVISIVAVPALILSHVKLEPRDYMFLCSKCLALGRMLGIWQAIES